MVDQLKMSFSTQAWQRTMDGSLLALVLCFSCHNTTAEADLGAIAEQDVVTEKLFIMLHRLAR